MARIRIFIVLALALTAGSAFAYATYQFVQQAPAPAEGMPTKPVVVAASDLQVGDEIGADDVRVIDWPASAAPEATFAKAEDVVGRGVVLPVVKNEPILPNKLAGQGAGSGLPPAIPDGMRALSVRVNEVIGVAGYVLPGTRVDVLATVNPTQQSSDVTSKVILTNVQVLAAGTKIERDGDEKPIAVSVVTLLVDPNEAERLTLASTEGKIQLALRNPLDKTAPATPGIRPAALLGGTPVRQAAVRRAAPMTKIAPKTPDAAPAPVQIPMVEMIRGEKRAQEAVRQE